MTQRDLFKVIDQVSPITGYEYNPRGVIRTVNALLPLGKDKALSVISAYLKRYPSVDHRASEGLFLVLRCLFEVPHPPGYMPQMRIGSPTPPRPWDSRLVPRFPLVLVEDVPLLVVAGYTIGGFPQPVEKHVEFFRKQGVLRAKPLFPSSRPLLLLSQVEKSPEWLWGRRYDGVACDGRRQTFSPNTYSKRRGRHVIMNQLLRLVASVYPRPANEFGNRIDFDGDPDKVWEQAQREVSALNVRWDEKPQDYVKMQRTSR